MLPLTIKTKRIPHVSTRYIGYPWAFSNTLAIQFGQHKNNLEVIHTQSGSINLPYTYKKLHITAVLTACSGADIIGTTCKTTSLHSFGWFIYDRDTDAKTLGNFAWMSCGY